jgi:2-keto-4-pentenoate hydratase
MPSYEEAAVRLRAAYTKGPVAPLRDVLEPTAASGAYEIQAINTHFWQAQGRRIIGRKIGLTAKAVQAQLGVDQPDFGVLFEDMLIPDKASLAVHKLIQPKVEAEVAIVLERDIDKLDATADDIAAATAYAVAAIEVVDSRIADWKITFADTVADNGSSAFFVLGKETKKLTGLDLYTCGMALEINKTLVSLGAGAACLGHPLIAAAWLARTLSALGEGLKAGDVLMTGALGPMVKINPGDMVEAKIGGLGQVSFTYEDSKA